MQTIPLPIDDPNAPITLSSTDSANCIDPQPRDPVAHPLFKPRPVFTRTYVTHAVVETQEDDES